MERTILDVPFNVTPKSTALHEQFLEEIKTRDVNFIFTFHKYMEEKDRFVNKDLGQGLE